MSADPTRKPARRWIAGEGESHDRHAELVARLARELVEQGRRAAELQRLADRRRRRADRLERRLEEVYASETWRVGTVLLWLPRRVKALLRRD